MYAIWCTERQTNCNPKHISTILESVENNNYSGKFYWKSECLNHVRVMHLKTYTFKSINCLQFAYGSQIFILTNERMIMLY